MKKRLSSAISSFREFIGHRKKACTSPGPVGVDTSTREVPDGLSAHLSSGDANTSIANQYCEPEVAPLPAQPPSGGGIVPLDHERDIDGGEDISLAQRRPQHQNCQLPLRFRDVLPQPLPMVPMEVRAQPPESVGSVVTSAQPLTVRAHTVFHTLPNIFGLVHQYFSLQLPSHNPEEYTTLTDLSFIPGSPQVPDQPYPFAASSSKSQYYPYPNRSSFQLGDWYWNQGVQKLQSDYTKLLEILDGNAFNVANMTSTHWKKINCQLGGNEYDEGDGEEWEDEDAGWKCTPVSIEVPFSHTTDMPGPRLYRAADLYHLSLVAVIWEKLANVCDDKLFHYELYQLCWNPPHLDNKVLIYRDLYTSPGVTYPELWLV
ncbi:uncharacterized protein BJ212DRAFT_1487020 [Suillus subaureus]|uniref:Uncharacterized protein n=1 Tax=Suillus subaureus TaxID=48587 RepID=A0A9P7J4Y7_9AGAM|nr:uncharacterized protein BJ212DRAFT_1487020 [Suillus subaureus]KAG1803419.1 hypothetical protein BJ212DRAFT_1487020 [Suillus subaureus]